MLAKRVNKRLYIAVAGLASESGCVVGYRLYNPKTDTTIDVRNSELHGDFDGAVSNICFDGMLIKVVDNRVGASMPCIILKTGKLAKKCVTTVTLVGAVCVECAGISKSIVVKGAELKTVKDTVYKLVDLNGDTIHITLEELIRAGLLPKLRNAELFGVDLVQKTALGTRSVAVLNVEPEQEITEAQREMAQEQTLLQELTAAVPVIVRPDGTFVASQAARSIVVPSGVVYLVPNAAFKSFKQLEELILEDGIVALGTLACAYCVNLKTAHIPKSVASIGAYAFKAVGTSTAAGADIEIQGIDSFGGGVFEGAKLNNLKLGFSRAKANVTLSMLHTAVVRNLEMSGVSELSMQFACGARLGAVKITPLTPRGYTIADEAFLECVGVNLGTVAAQAWMVGRSAFQRAKGVGAVWASRYLASLGSQAFMGSDITEFVVPQGGVLRDVGADAFKGCVRLTHIDLGTQVRRIGSEAFSDCPNLVQLSIPPTLERIDCGAFKGVSQSLLASFPIPTSLNLISTRNKKQRSRAQPSILHRSSADEVRFMWSLWLNSDTSDTDYCVVD